MRNRRPSFASTRYAGIVGQAATEITAALRRATLVTGHGPTSGGIRESGLRDFLRQLLPDRYYVGTGFAFDAQDHQSRQLDVVIALEPPLLGVFEKDGVCNLPCEVVLAAIEVKKTLSVEEVRKSLSNALALRDLRPYGTQMFTSARRQGAKLEKGHHRCFYSVVAHESDLVVGDTWAQREWDRYRAVATDLDVAIDAVDRVFILDRGLVNTVEAVASSDPAEIDALVNQWFIHLSNHLDREAARRPQFDPDIYTKGVRWEKLQ